MKREKRLGIPFFSPSPEDQREFKDDDQADNPERGINRARLHLGLGGSQALIESRKRKYGDGYELDDESDEKPIDHHVMFPHGETRSFRGPDENPDMQAVRATDVAMGGKNMSRTVKPIQAPLGSHPLFVRGNPMEMAWRLLKNMGDDDPAFAEHRRMIEEVKQQEQRVRQQAQEQAPKETPRVQQYNLQLAQRRAQQEFEQKLRAARKAGGRVDHMFPEIHAYAEEHGKLPMMPKKLKSRFLEYRARMEDE